MAVLFAMYTIQYSARRARNYTIYCFIYRRLSKFRDVLLVPND